MRTDLTDADREPSDEEVVELARAAFAGVTTARQGALDALRARITEESAKVLVARGHRDGHRAAHR